MQQLVTIGAGLNDCLDGQEKGVRALLSGTIPAFMRELEQRLDALGVLEKEDSFGN